MTKPKHTARTASIRHRQIGRKALQADRLSKILSVEQPKKRLVSWRTPSINTKTFSVIGVVIIVVSVLAFGASNIYLKQIAASQRAAAIQQDKEIQAKSKAADACRRKKAEQKADQIGKITYDELYDHGECDT